MWNLSVYRNAPRNMKPKARTSPPPAPTPAPTPAGKTPDFSAMARRLAVAAAL